MNQDDRIVIDLFEKRLHNIEKHQITANRELGEVVGKVKIILWLMGGTFLVVVGHLFYDVFFG